MAGKWPERRERERERNDRSESVQRKRAEQGVKKGLASFRIASLRYSEYSGRRSGSAGNFSFRNFCRIKLSRRDDCLERRLGVQRKRLFREPRPMRRGRASSYIYINYTRIHYPVVATRRTATISQSLHLLSLFLSFSFFLSRAFNASKIRPFPLSSVYRLST